MTPLREWMSLATTVEQNELARKAKTSREYLYQLSNGLRKAGSDIAGRIEVAAKTIRKASKGRLPRLTRADLSSTCGECPYSRKCLKG